MSSVHRVQHSHGENSASAMSSVSQNIETKLSDEIKLCFQIFQVRFCEVRYWLNWKYPKLIINYMWVTDLQRSTQTTPSNINIWCYITPDCGGIPVRLTPGWQWHNNIQWSAPAITLTVWQQGCCQGFPPPLSPVSLCVPVVVSCWGYCSNV